MEEYLERRAEERKAWGLSSEEEAQLAALDRQTALAALENRRRLLAVRQKTEMMGDPRGTGLQTVAHAPLERLPWE